MDDAPMVRVPAGEFIMGSDMKEIFTFQDRASEEYRKQYEGTHTIVTVSPRYFANELPRRTLYLDEFYIDQYEVTNARYRRCVEAGVCRSPSGFPSSPAYDDHPVLVTWTEAEAYCRWAGKRLPTEMEWEKAARGTDGRWWPWGNEWEEGQANTFSQRRGIAPVGSYAGDASPYGALDMAGNVREWVDDWYQPYGGSDFRSELFGEQRKVVRGGTWDEVGMEARTAFRLPLKPDEIEAAIGFRCLKGGPKPTPELTPTPRPTLTPDPNREMVYVPEGEFLMGKREDEIPDIERYDEVPQHKVYLDAFYMDKYEVTNAQYVAFLKDLGVYHGWACEGRPCMDVQSDNPYSRILYDPEGGQYAVEVGYEDHPVVTVSWYGAKAYCEHYGLRLPTEAEWEKAARGTDARIWPWGDEPPDGTRANYCDSNCSEITFGSPEDKTVDDGYALTAPVGSYPEGASPYGALDMAGNVGEWVSDWCKLNYYQHSPYRNPQGPHLSEEEAIYKVIRGGSWGNPSLLIRAATRFGVDLDRRREITGFRCARSAE